MFNKSYSNFVKASSPEKCSEVTQNQEPVLRGEEARQIYLKEVKNAKSNLPSSSKVGREKKKNKSKQEVPTANHDLFVTVQNNDIDKMRLILDRYPDKINVIDDYGWSLLMIACQANAIDSAKELLSRGIDMSIRDKAGNSARSLVIKNKNYTLANVLLQHKETEAESYVIQSNSTSKLHKEYRCDVCNKTFAHREEHLSSTLHNISASKGKKIPANYVIPTTNRGYQLMLKGGWDRDSGLGRDGSGKIYPIKTVQKKDRKGLGHKKKPKEKILEDTTIKNNSKKMFADNYKSNRIFEINFRREFY